MTCVGEILREARESQGRDLTEIASELCITPSYLRAIEKDDVKSLPGSFFYKSFIKQYAAILGVDGEQIQPGIDALIAAANPPPLPGAVSGYANRLQNAQNDDRLLNLVAPGPALRGLDPLVEDGNRRYFPDRRLGLSLTALIAMLLGCSGFYAWWNKAPRSARDANFAMAASQVQPMQGAPKAIDSVKTDPAVPSQDPTVDVTATAAADGLNHVVLSLSATEETWLSITSEGKEIFSGILQPSQTKTLTGLEVAKMKVGNAGGLEVRWNGKAIGPIGRRGQVRVVLFTPENVQILGPAQTSSQDPSETL